MGFTCCNNYYLLQPELSDFYSNLSACDAIGLQNKLGKTTEGEMRKALEIK